MKGAKFETVDEYFSALPVSAKARMKDLRSTIKKAAPKAEEVISYNMPAFKLNGALVYYAAYKEHVGFYPVSSAIREFKDQLDSYEVSKGTIRFSLDEPIPLGLVSKIVRFRVKENLAKAKFKKRASIQKK